MKDVFMGISIYRFYNGLDKDDINYEKVPDRRIVSAKGRFFLKNVDSWDECTDEAIIEYSREHFKVRPITISFTEGSSCSYAVSIETFDRIMDTFLSRGSLYEFIKKNN